LCLTLHSPWCEPIVFGYKLVTQMGCFPWRLVYSWQERQWIRSVCLTPTPSTAGNGSWAGKRSIFLGPDPLMLHC
jgi:hypothetical protein